jgi:circadian clock protein KaiB
MSKRAANDLESLEAAAKAAAASVYELHLVISGSGHHSATALSNVRRFCEEHLRGRYTLALTDLGKDPRKARELEIFATPTLIREAPVPVQRFIGNMSRLERLLVATERESPPRPSAPDEE